MMPFYYGNRSSFSIELTPMQTEIEMFLVLHEMQGICLKYSRQVAAGGITLCLRQHFKPSYRRQEINYIKFLETVTVRHVDKLPTAVIEMSALKVRGR